MKKWSKFLGGILAALGILVVIFPAFWIKIIVVLLGAAAVVYGIYNILVTKKVFENSRFTNVILLKSIVSIMVGTLAVVVPLAFVNTIWKVMMYILAVYLVIAGGMGFYSVTLLKDSSVDRKKYVWENLILFIAAVLLFLISPEKLGSAIVRIVGIVTFIAGGVMLFLQFGMKKKEIVVEAEVVDDETEEMSESNEENKSE